MDFDEITKEFIDTVKHFHHRDMSKGMNENMRGEPMIMTYIMECGDIVTPGEISKHTGITSARVAAVLGSLEKKGLIVRSMDLNDRRKIRIAITDAGKDYVDNRKKEMFGMIRAMLEYLGEEDAAELVRIIKKLKLWKASECGKGE